MKKKIILITLITLIIFPIVNAALPQPVERGECANIKIPYDAVWINISTITYPNQTMVSLDATASKTGNTFFYNDFCNTDQIGDYTYEFFANDGFTSGNSFKVTEYGDKFETSQSIIYIPLLIINILALTLFIILSIKIPYGNKKDILRGGHEVITQVTKTKYLKLFAIWISYGLFMWLVTIITGMIRNYISFEPLKNMATNLYLFSSALSYIVAVFMVWFIFINIWRDIILNKKILKEGKAFLNELK